MLVLSREIGRELVLIAPGFEPVVIKIIEVRQGGNVRLGITADKQIGIYRKEVLEAIQRQEPMGIDYKPPCRGVRDEGND